MAALADVAADLEAVSAVLKEWYIGPTAEQLNQEVMVTQLLGVSSENLEGLKAVLPLHTARSGGIGSRRERAELPKAGKQGYGRAEYDLKYHYARAEVTGQAIQRTQSDRGAFLQAFKSELSFIRKDIQLDMARQFYGDGTGVVATVLSEATPVLTLDSAEPLVKGFLYVGFVADGGTAADPTAHFTEATVIDIDVDNATVTFDTPGGGTIAAADSTTVLVRAGNVADSTDPDEVDEINAGLRAIISAAPLGGIDPTDSGKSFWQGIVENPSGTGPTLDILQRAYNRVNNAGGRADSVVVMTTPGMVRELFASGDFSENVRFVNSTTLRGGFEELSFAAGAGPMKINADRLAPWGEIAFVDKAHVQAYSPAEWDFLSRDGLSVRWVPDYDAFQSLLFRYLNLGADRRNTSMRLTAMTDDVDGF
jgi:hypothetical protein